MWLITTSGFFSIVEKPGDRADGTLTVRARVATDLDRLRRDFLSELGPTETGKGTDYRYRARAPRAAVMAALPKMIEAIDYVNFKNRVAQVDGTDRAHAYGRVWDALADLEDAGAPRGTRR